MKIRLDLFTPSVVQGLEPKFEVGWKWIESAFAINLSRMDNVAIDGKVYTITDLAHNFSEGLYTQIVMVTPNNELAASKFDVNAGKGFMQ